MGYANTGAATCTVYGLLLSQRLLPMSCQPEQLMHVLAITIMPYYEPTTFVMTHVGVAHVGVAHVGVAHVGVAHVGVAHVGVAHVGVAHVGVGHAY